MCITIKPADKGGALVVMDTAPYLCEICDQLNDIEVYEKVGRDLTEVFRRQLVNMLENLKTEGVIDEKLLDFLCVSKPMIPVLYTLPKIDKNLERPPVRPIVSGRGSLFSHVAVFLEKVLRRYAMNAKSYIRDTNEVG